jgi:NADPH:quinone reductase-like Zn-dependent oxidoreductase
MHPHEHERVRTVAAWKRSRCRSPNWIKPLSGAIQAAVLSLFVDEELGMMLAELNQDDLNRLGDLAQAGKITPVIDRQYPLSETPAAIAYLEEGRARGKVVVNVR